MVYRFGRFSDIEIIADTQRREGSDLPFVDVDTHAMLPLEPTDGMIETAEELIADYRQNGCRVYAGDIWDCMVKAYRASQS